LGVGRTLGAGLGAGHAEPLAADRPVRAGRAVRVLDAGGAADSVDAELAARAVLVQLALVGRLVVGETNPDILALGGDRRAAEILARGAGSRGRATLVTYIIQTNHGRAAIRVLHAEVPRIGDADRALAHLAGAAVLVLGATRGALSIEADSAGAAVVIELAGLDPAAVPGAGRAHPVEAEPIVAGASRLARVARGRSWDAGSAAVANVIAAPRAAVLARGAQARVLACPIAAIGACTAVLVRRAPPARGDALLGEADIACPTLRRGLTALLALAESIEGIAIHVGGALAVQVTGATGELAAITITSITSILVAVVPPILFPFAWAEDHVAAGQK
jgi:hypothetical protein